MSNYKIAIIGTKDAVAGFALLGVDVTPVNDATEAVEKVHKLRKTKTTVDGVERPAYAIIFITEDLASALTPDDEKKIARDALPAVIALPSHKGSTGYGLQRLKGLVERAVGSDILQ